MFISFTGGKQTSRGTIQNPRQARRGTLSLVLVVLTAGAVAQPSFAQSLLRCETAFQSHTSHTYVNSSLDHATNDPTLRPGDHSSDQSQPTDRADVADWLKSLDEVPNSDTDLASYSRNQVRAKMLEHGRNKTRFTIATWNLNRINTKAMGMARNPIYFQTRDILKVTLREFLRNSSAPDVFVLQEIWEKPDHDIIVAAAQESGFIPLRAEGEWMERAGLQILIRKASGAEVYQSDFIPYANKAGKLHRALWENLGKVDRGLLYVKLLLPDGRKLLVGTTHKTPLTMHAKIREKQLGSLEQILPSLVEDVDAYSISGDFNIAADFSGARGAEAKRLQSLRSLYTNLFRQLGFIDTFRAVHTASEDPGYTLNASFPTTALLLLAQKVARRIDYIFVGETKPKTKVYVENSRLIFTRPLDPESATFPDDESGLPISDHYGQRSELILFDYDSVAEPPP